MQFIPEVDSWTPCAERAFAEQLSHVQRSWKSKSDEVEAILSATVARQLSVWSKPQMQRYERVPSPKEVKFVPISSAKDGRYIVFKATIDALPTHSPLVRRWLVAYILWNAEADLIERVTLTIRGTVEE